MFVFVENIFQTHTLFKRKTQNFNRRFSLSLSLSLSLMSLVLENVWVDEFMKISTLSLSLDDDDDDFENSFKKTVFKKPFLLLVEESIDEMFVFV